ncbi:hypothetical protein LTR08_005789 [Meristemomyces frigidus]|nr:hypothetical protein LTR08_005789 [Meristemomyces frigidus]
MEPGIFDFGFEFDPDLPTEAEHDQTTTANPPTYPTPVPGITNHIHEDSNPMDQPLVNGVVDNAFYDDPMAMAGNPFGPNRVRDTRIMVILLQSITEVLTALLAVNSLLRSAESDGLPNTDVLKSSAAATLSLKAALLPLLTQVRSQISGYHPAFHNYGQLITAAQEPNERRLEGYGALIEAARVCLSIENAVRRCEASKWASAWLYDGIDINGTMDGGAWTASDALNELVGIQVRLQLSRHEGSGGGAGWWELWDVDLANP